MNEVQESPLRVQLAAACAAAGITGPEDFRYRYGIAPGILTVTAMLALLETPDWVRTTWLRNSGTTPVVYIPESVRRYAAAFHIVQHEGESLHEFNDRIRDTLSPLAVTARARKSP